MVIKTKEEYVNRLKKMEKNVFINGKRVDHLDELLIPGINVVGITFEMATNPEFEDLFTAKSHITGEKINRFTHICQNKEDLLKKQEMVCQGCYHTASCIQRCMGMDAINALSVVTKNLDTKFNTNYYKRFIDYLKYFQANDLVAAAAQTDVKGDRLKRPHEQKDPDLYLHFVEKRENGIIVRGAKHCITIAPYADEIIVLPTRAMRKEDAEWAVAFAIPADTKGVKLVSTSVFPPKRIKLDAPVSKMGVSDSTIIFDDVFVPWERVFMCGEWQMARSLALLFALYHRHSYSGCKPAISDILGGTAALAAECNNIENAIHVREKLSKFIGLAELAFAAGIASAHSARKAPSGTMIPDPVYANVGRRLTGENIYNEYYWLTDIVGGIATTLAPEGDFYADETGSLLNKYIKRNPKVSAEHTHRAFRLVEDLASTHWAGWLQIAGVHGGGSPIMETITVMTDYDIEGIKDIARYLSGIKKELPRIRRENLIKGFKEWIPDSG